MILDHISSMGSSQTSGIGRRRGAAATGNKTSLTSIIVIAASFTFTLLIILFIRYAVPPPTNGEYVGKDKSQTVLSTNNAINSDTSDNEEFMSKQFGKWAGIIRADLHLVGIETFGMADASADSKKFFRKGKLNNNSGSRYKGVKASFCKLDWDQYKKDPPSFPMFRMLLHASGCDKKKNIITIDLASVVQKAREYDRSIENRQTHNTNNVHGMPPSGFIFHESRVGSTLVANSLTAMDPEGHRVYSESNPINDALKACQGILSTCDMDTNADLLRDVVYLMGRTSSPTEKHMFFKVSSIGSKQIDVMRAAFPEVPWIFVFRDPVQTMMSHLDPEKIGKSVSGGGSPKAVCLRTKNHPPEDLVELASEFGSHVDELTAEGFCAVHLATLCESALEQMQDSNGKGVAVEYDNLIDKLITKIIPDHFLIHMDETARQRILDVSKIYSKSKGGTKDWVSDSRTKDIRSTPEIRAACQTFLSSSYTELKKYTIV